MALVPSGRSRFTNSGRPQGLNKVQGIAKPILIEFLKVDRIRETNAFIFSNSINPRQCGQCVSATISA
jgi:hypothetical protein